jgi:uncharacterized protein YidB (DUF937 family)
MGLLDSVVGALAGGQSGGNSGLVDVVMQLINNQPGGLAGLVQSFQQGGLADIVNSWVSTGQNLPISAEQLQSVLGGGPLCRILRPNWVCRRSRRRAAWLICCRRSSTS